MRTFTSGKMSEKGQLVIPQKLRETLQLEEGDRIEFTVEDSGEVRIHPIKRRSIIEAVGIIKTNVKFIEDLTEVREEARREALAESWSKT